MNLSVGPRPKGRKYLTIVKSYRDPVTKKPRTRQIKALGYLDVLEKEYPDPIAHFKEVARKMTEEENNDRRLTLNLMTSEHLAAETGNRKNYGYAALMKIYQELGLNEFLSSVTRRQKLDPKLKSIVPLLVISRILAPGPVKNAFEERNRYFDQFDFGLADIYEALHELGKISNQVQNHIYEQIRKKYGCTTAEIYFGLTEFHYSAGEFVQIGLALDGDGIPLGYKLFSGDERDSGAFDEFIEETCKTFGAGRIIVTGDLGVLTVNDIWHLIGNRPNKPKHGYVYRLPIAGGRKELKEYVLSQEGYLNLKGEPAGEDDDFKMKTRRVAHNTETAPVRSGDTATKIVYEKQLVFWDRKYAAKTKAERDVVLDKAKTMVRDPAKYKRQTWQEIAGAQLLSLDHETIGEDEKYEGYCVIVASEYDMEDKTILDNYRELWEIEEIFRTGQDEAGTNAEANCLICFIAFTFVRLLHKLTKKEYSTEKIVAALNRISCSVVQDNMYMFDYRSTITDAIGNAVGIDFTKKYMQLSDIKKNF